MHVEFVSYQESTVPPSLPSKESLLRRFPAAARCPAITPTLSAGLWIYPPFDADIEIDGEGGFSVRVHQALESIQWIDQMERLVDWGSTWWCSKIPGVFQIDPGMLFVTEPGEKLVVTQPVNEHQRDFFTQTGLIDSDCFYAPFTINVMPVRGLNRFSIRRTQPIAHLLSPTSFFSQLSFNVADISQRPDILNYWRTYIDTVFGPRSASRTAEAKRIRSVYSRWTSPDLDQPKP